MTLVQIIKLAIMASVFLLVFAIGLNATFRDVNCLFRRPGLLARSLLSMNLVMPLFAVALALLFKIDPAIKIALVALALSPVPPLLPRRLAKAGGSEDYTIGLLAAAAAAAIIVIPLGIAVLEYTLDRELNVSPVRVASLVLVTVLVPLMAGVLAHRVSPELAGKIAHPISRFATIVLVVAVLPILFIASKAIWALLGNGMVVCLALFIVVGLVVGHLLGGPVASDRTVLAIATAIRHPGMALSIATMSFPGEKEVMPVIACYLIVGVAVSLPYIKWRSRTHAAAQSGFGGPTPTHA